MNNKNNEHINNNNNNNKDKILLSPEVIYPSIQNQHFDQEILDLTNKIADLNINKELEPMIVETLELIGENVQSDQEKLKIKVLNPNVVLPLKKHDSDVGFDVTAINSTTILPGQIVSIPLGFAATPPKGIFIKIEAHSSLAK